MIQFSCIAKGETIPAGIYFERNKVLKLIEEKYGYKWTFYDFYVFPFVSVEHWYGIEYINLDGKLIHGKIGTDAVDYIKENLEPRIVEEVKYQRIYDKIIHGSQYVIEEATSDTQVVYQLTIYSQSGADAECYSFSSSHEAKVYIANII